MRGDGYVYALTEGDGLYGSANKGGSWRPPAPLPAPSISLAVHPAKPTHLFGGQQRYATLAGGVFLSTDSGKAFAPIGLAGVTVAGVAINAPGTRLYASAYGSGIYTAPIPASASSAGTRPLTTRSAPPPPPRAHCRRCSSTRWAGAVASHASRMSSRRWSRSVRSTWMRIAG